MTQLHFYTMNTCVSHFTFILLWGLFLLWCVLMHVCSWLCRFDIFLICGLFLRFVFTLAAGSRVDILSQVIGLSIHHFGPELNVTTAGWITKKFCTDIQCHGGLDW